MIKTLSVSGSSPLPDSSLTRLSTLAYLSAERTRHVASDAKAGFRTLARRAEVVAALRAIAPGEGLIEDPAMLRPYESDGLTA